jgi:hypothetical protein
MNLEELEEELDQILQPGYSIETDKRGQLIIITNLRQDEDGELFPFSEEEEVDPDFDPDFDPLEEEDVEDD